MLRQTLFTTIALCVATATAADPPTTDIFLAGFQSQDVVGSVIASDATATTFAVACANTADAKCQIPPNFIFTQGPSTMHYQITHAAQASDDVTGTIDVGCVITVDHGVCTKSVNAILGTITSTATSSTTTFSGASAMSGQILTVTGGKLVLPTTASSTSSSSSSSKSSSSSQSSSSSSHSSSSHSSTITSAPTLSSSTSVLSSPSSSAEIAASSSVSTGGMARATGSARWVAGGVAAAAVALAAL